METLEILYTARAHNAGGRDGRATAADGFPDLVVKPPVELGGPDVAEATNPEELFALGYGACFLSALSLVARSQGVSTEAFRIDSAVSLGREGEAFGLAVELHGTLPGVEPERAAELMRAAHHVCPYSRATRGNVDVRLVVADQPVA
jgi:Ohr subfamily peroxiredoxin